MVEPQFFVKMSGSVEKMKYVLTVPNMVCNHCKMRISNLLNENGVRNYQIDLQNKKIILETQEIEKICKKLAEIGYPVAEYKTS